MFAETSCFLKIDRDGHCTARAPRMRSPGSEGNRTSGHFFSLSFA